MSLKDSIDRAAKAAGSQKALADLMGIKAQSVSGFKTGVPCGAKKRAQIAAIAGEEAAHLIIEGVIEGLSENIPHEAEARKGLIAMLNTFPAPETKLTNKRHESQNTK